MAVNPYVPVPLYQVFSKIDVYTLYQNLVAALGNATYYGSGLPTVRPNSLLIDTDLYKWFIDITQSNVYSFQNGGWTLVGQLANPNLPTLNYTPVLTYDPTSSNLTLSGANTVTLNGVQSFPFVQSTATLSWYIVHPLKRKPNVVVLDNQGEQVFGTVDYLDNNTITILFTIPFSGTAYLN